MKIAAAVAAKIKAVIDFFTDDFLCLAKAGDTAGGDKLFIAPCAQNSAHKHGLARGIVKRFADNITAA